MWTATAGMTWSTPRRVCSSNLRPRVLSVFEPSSHVVFTRVQLRSTALIFSVLVSCHVAHPLVTGATIFLPRHKSKGFLMFKATTEHEIASATDRDRDVTAVSSVPLINGFGLTLVCDADGWRFSAWHALNGYPVNPRPTADDLDRHFESTVKAAAYFKQEYGDKLRHA